MSGERFNVISIGFNQPQEIMERVRILCSIYDPLTGRYRTNYSLYFQLAGFLTFVGSMIYLSVDCQFKSGWPRRG